MITKRIIPCLDIRDGRVVKGVNFEGVKDVSDPVALASYITIVVQMNLYFMTLPHRVKDEHYLPMFLKKLHPAYLSPSPLAVLSTRLMTSKGY